MIAKIYGPQVRKPSQIELPAHSAQPAIQPRPAVEKSSFQKILEQKTAVQEGGVSFSAHAAKRLEQRAIDISSEDIQRLSSAVDKAAVKGSRESLVLLNDLAFVVSVANRKVITAMGTEQMKESVITNIDSAIIA